MKMVTLMKTVLVVALAAAIRSEETSMPREESATPKGKLLFYGRRFQLAKDSQHRKDELYSPLITSPIRALPPYLNNSHDHDTETLKRDQNEIFSNIRDLFREKTEGSFNETYFLEDANEEENHGGEATPKSTRQDSSGEAKSSVPKSRQDGDRSLLVVLPFKADKDNVEELFTKSPLVKVIDNDESGGKSGTTMHPPVTREILPTTVPTMRRWRPIRNYRTTTEVSILETTTEEDLTKTYTNYNDAEMVTKKYETPETEPQNLTNHKFGVEAVNPHLVFNRLRNKTKKDEVVTKQQQTEDKTTTEALRASTTEKLKPKLKRKGQRRKPTTEGPPKPEELSKVLDILPSDLKDLILQIGLDKDNKEEQASENNFRLERPPQPTIDPMSYAMFKRLPVEVGQDDHRNFVPDDMKDFLASFGLLPLGRRIHKSLKSEAPEKKTQPVEDIAGVDLNFLPDDLKSLLQDMGFVTDSDRKEPTRIHIFNPSNYSIAHSEEDIEKLNAILSSIKTTVNESQSLTPEMQSEIIAKIRELNNPRYKNGNLSEINNEIKKIVVNGKVSRVGKSKTTAKRATKLFDGPDPVMFSEESLLKNDVKRQDNSTSTSVSSSAASSSSSSSPSSSASKDSVNSYPSGGDLETTTEEPPNIEALKESFGGGETASDDADVESSLPPKRPNGLYLLLDWNSFLEVGTDDDNRRVNLRFQPKIGDSRNFLPVSVP